MRWRPEGALRRALLAAACAVALALAVPGAIWWYLQPVEAPRPLPDSLIGMDDPRGRSLLQAADARADHARLGPHFRPQRLRSYCGVASSVMVLRALGRPVTQDQFFDDAASAVRSRLAVSLGGMSLDQLGALLRAHGLTAEIRYADAVDIAELRAAVLSNLADPDDFLLVNYQRAALGQDRVGHISPLGAYHHDSDRVLILDTASYHYPHTWVPLTDLYQAMATTDPASGRSRGWVVVRQLSSAF